MKTRLSFLIVMLLVLPLVLAACGGGDTDTAKKYVEAIANNDKDEIEKHICEDNKDKLDSGPGDAGSFEVDDLKCEEDGDDVKCTMKSTLGLMEEKVEVEMVFAMKDGKVCDINAMKLDGEEVPLE